MVAHIHPVLDHALVGPLIQVDREGDGVFLLSSQCWYEEDVRVKVTHMRYGRVPLVEWPPIVNEGSGSFLVRN